MVAVKIVVGCENTLLLEIVPVIMCQCAQHALVASFVLVFLFNWPDPCERCAGHLSSEIRQKPAVAVSCYQS